MLHSQEQHCRGSFVYSGHSSAGHLPEDMLFHFITFLITSEKVQTRHTWKDAVFLVLDWFADQLLHGILCRWLLQPASLWGPYSQEGRHNHDNGKDGIEGQASGVKWGQRCCKCSWCADVFEPPCFSSISSFFFFFSSPTFLSRLPVYCELLLLTSVFVRAPQWL